MFTDRGKYYLSKNISYFSSVCLVFTFFDTLETYIKVLLEYFCFEKGTRNRESSALF